MNSMRPASFFGSTAFRGVMIACGVLFIFLVGFGIGMKVGFHKALFSAKWGEQYEKNFLDRSERGMRQDSPRASFREKFEDMRIGKGMRSGHGIAGDVVSISDTSLVIKNPDNQENTIQTNDQTTIARGQETVAPKDIAIGSRVIVLGKPQDDGVILARFIRVFGSEVQKP